ncbi:hepatic triacylglycerol lipase isoform X2 [Puntigrus tetrazona]|uniref:hepatic triacylglycerol lipase isoform X2 n=1 Tax=Puntigrus tetrazona TaxID=1606681 RepID=UPI001C89DFF4|nr:hepatic triacylglycerol lipase isoform X2 [Puntigrus tetrazona]
MIMRVLSAFLLLRAVAASVRGDMNFTETPSVKTVLKSSFHLYHEGRVFEETCAVVPFRSESLHRCAYNHSDPLVLIIHGWTMNGLMEPWIFNLASAVKVRLERVNVLISDWRKLALQPYPIAAKNSRQVGQDVAALLKWLEEVAQLSMDDVHLIGYSLGAHVAGFAGSHFRGLRKVGRITGLDPAGPHFEGLPAFDRLSPDDAQFVDAVHTFTGSSLVPGVGIKQSVAHVDFYPNGGSFQPGCKMTDIYSNVFQYGLQGVPKTIKCAHERAVKLFTDSLINASQPIIGYRCRDDSAFSRGLCLDCKQQRCNTLGFGVRRERSGRSAKGLFLRTAPQPPYRVFHYQIRVLLKNLIEPLESSLFVTLNGSGGESPELPIKLQQESGALKSFSSLLAVDSDLGQLRSVRLVWKGDLVWPSWMRSVRNIMNWNSSDRDTELSVWRIRIKSGETQEKWWFCGVSAGVSRLRSSEEQEFVRCRINHQDTNSSASTQSVY